MTISAIRATTQPLANAGVYHGDLEIYTVDDLKKLAGISEVVGNVTISIDEPIVLPSLVKVEGALFLGSSSAIDLSQLKQVSGGVAVAGNHKITTISFPRLEEAGNMAIGSRSYPLFALKSLDLSSLTHVHSLEVTSTGLTSLSLPNLQVADDMLRVAENEKLRSFDAPAFRAVGTELSIYNNPNLASLVLSSLTEAEPTIVAKLTENPKVPSAAMDAIVQKLRAAGVTKIGR